VKIGSPSRLDTLEIQLTVEIHFYRQRDKRIEANGVRKE